LDWDKLGQPVSRLVVSVLPNHQQRFFCFGGTGTKWDKLGRELGQDYRSSGIVVFPSPLFCGLMRFVV